MRSLVFTPVIAHGDVEVHALTLRDGKKTACGKTSGHGFRIALKPLNCEDCKLAVGRKRASKRKKSR